MDFAHFLEEIFDRIYTGYITEELTERDCSIIFNILGIPDVESSRLVEMLRSVKAEGREEKNERRRD